MLGISLRKILCLSLICNIMTIQLFATTQAIILAAGKSSRFRTEKSKLLHTLCGKEMILYPINALNNLNIPTTLVVGHQAENIQQTVLTHYPSSTFIVQHEQKGTGHALACTQKMWYAKTVIVLNGDMPLVTQEIIEQLIDCHQSSHATVTFAVSNTKDPGAKGFGRVIEENGSIKIVEVKHLEGNPDDFPIVNVGIYVFDTAFLHDAIDKLEQHNLTQEFYITDLIEIANNLGKKISIIHVPFDNARGVNTIEEFSKIQALKRNELVNYWMQRGVIFSHPKTVELDYSVSIGAGTYIGQGVHIRNNTKIEKNCIIGPFTFLDETHIGQSSHIMSHCLISGIDIENKATIPPHSFITNNKM